MNPRIFTSAALIALMTLVGCGGGGGGSTIPSGGSPPPSSGQSSVSGVAASGRPIANTVVTLKDATGASKTATTASDGSFTIDTTGLTAPFLLLVTSASGTKLYSASADANARTTINITPLSDLIVRSWYGVQSVNVDTAFGAPAANAAPQSAAVAILNNAVTNMVQLWLNKAGVASGFNAVSTPFSANNTGADLVLDQATINGSAGTVRITDGTSTQNSTLTFAAGAVTIATTTVGAGGATSSSSFTTVVPAQPSSQTALAAILAQVQAFQTVISGKGSALAVSDVMPFLDPALNFEGFNAQQFAQDLVAGMGGATLSLAMQQVVSLTATDADILFNATQTRNGQSQTQPVELRFHLNGSSWLLSGNNQNARLILQAEMRTTQGSQTNGSAPDVNVDVQALQKYGVTNVTVTGSPWNAAALTKAPGIVDGPTNLTLDHFYIYTGPLQSLPAAGTTYTFALTTASGTLNYALKLNAWTNDSAAFTTIPGTAQLGTPMNVAWRLPTTFAIARVGLSGHGFTGPTTDPSALECVNEAFVGTSSTSGTITIPATCQGKPTTAWNVTLSIDGVNGERDTVLYFY